MVLIEPSTTPYIIQNWQFYTGIVVFIITVVGTAVGITKYITKYEGKINLLNQRIDHLEADLDRERKQYSVIWDNLVSEGLSIRNTGKITETITSAIENKLKQLLQQQHYQQQQQHNNIQEEREKRKGEEE